MDFARVRLSVSPSLPSLCQPLIDIMCTRVEMELELGFAVTQCEWCLLGLLSCSDQNCSESPSCATPLRLHIFETWLHGSLAVIIVDTDEFTP